MFPVAWITFRRITERSILMQFGILAVVLILIGLDLDAMLPANFDNAQASGQGVIWVFLGFFTLFWSSIEIPREIMRQESHVFLSKSLTRMGYLIGKFMGMSAMTVGGQIILTIVFILCLLTRGSDGMPGIAFYCTSVQISLFLILLTALCIPISLLLAELPTIVATLVILLLGFVVYAMPIYAEASFFPAHTVWMKYAYYILPNLVHYRWPATWTATATATPMHQRYLITLACYTGAWASLSMLLANVFFRRQDLN